MQNRTRWFQLPQPPVTDPQFLALWETLSEQLAEIDTIIDSLLCVSEAIATHDITTGYFLHESILRQPPPDLLALPPKGRKIAGFTETAIKDEDSVSWEMEEVWFISAENQQKIEGILADSEKVITLIKPYLDPETKPTPKLLRPRKIDRAIVDPILSSTNIRVTPEQQEILEKNCLNHGILNALRACYILSDKGFILDKDNNPTEYCFRDGEIFRKDTLVDDTELELARYYDGHTRLEIAQKHSLPTEIICDRVFDSVEQAQQAIIELQSSSRNLNFFQSAFQVGEWVIAEKNVKSNISLYERARLAWNSKESNDTFSRKKEFAEELIFLGNQITLALEQESDNSDIRVALNYFRNQFGFVSDRDLPRHFIWRFLEILPPKPGYRYSKELTAIAKYQNQLPFVVGFLAYTLQSWDSQKDVEETGIPKKFADPPKFRPYNPVSITEKEHPELGRRGTIKTFDHQGLQAYLEICGKEDQEILVPLSGLKKLASSKQGEQPPEPSNPIGDLKARQKATGQVFPDRPANPEPLTEFASIQPSDPVSLSEATARPPEPPKTQSSPPLVEPKQEDPPKVVPSKKPKAPSRDEIEAAIAVIQVAFEQKLLSEPDLDKLSLTIFPF